MPVLLSVLGLTMPIYAYLESPPTISTETESSKLPCPCGQTQPLCYCVALATLPIRQLANEQINVT